eukprot:SAG31_NODE_25292_length_464_cov_0.991781_1_plen_31_part_10
MLRDGIGASTQLECQALTLAIRPQGAVHRTS